MALRSVARRLLAARHLPQPWPAARGASFVSSASWGDLEEERDEIGAKETSVSNRSSGGSVGRSSQAATDTTTALVSVPSQSVIWGTIEKALETVHRWDMQVETSNVLS